MNFLFHTLYRFYLVSSSLRYWLSRRFTRPGLAILAALIVSGFMGVDTDNTVDYQAFTVLFFLLLIALAFTPFFSARFSGSRVLPRFATAGSPLGYKIAVRNLSSRPQSGLTLLENLADRRPSFQEWLAVQLHQQKHARSFRFSQRHRTSPFKAANVKGTPVPTIPANQQIEFRVELTPLRRGVLRFHGITLARPDPLGLFRAFSKVRLPQSVLVLPKRYLLPPIALPGSMKYQQGGVALASSVGQSEDFVALRDYRHGDPMRHIHWRSWARVGKPVVKEFEDEFFVRHALVLDTFLDHDHSVAFEEAVSLAASFACTIETQESLLDLLFVGPESFCFTAGRGLAHADQILEILASVHACQKQPFRVLETLVLNHIKIVSGCICVLLGWDEQRRELVRKIKTLGIPVLVFFIAPSSQESSPDLGPMRDEPHRFHVLVAGQIEEDLARLK